MICDQTRVFAKLLRDINDDNFNQFSMLMRKNGIDINARLPTNFTEADLYISDRPSLISIAAYYGSAMIYKILRDEGAEIHNDRLSRPYSKPILHYAYHGKNEQIIQELMEDKTLERKNMLDPMIRFGNVNRVREYMDNDKFEKKLKKYLDDRLNPLVIALDSGSMEMVKLIFSIKDKNEELYKKYFTKEALLMHHALQSLNNDIIEFVFRKILDENVTFLKATNTNQQTCLLYAISHQIATNNGFRQRNEMKINILDTFWNLLMNGEVSNELISFLSVTVDKYINIAYHYLSELNEAAKIKSLVDFTGDEYLHVPNLEGLTPLHIAISHRNNEAVEAIADFLGNLPVGDLKRTPLHESAIVDWAEGFSKIMHKFPSALDCTDSSGLTPTLLAAIYGSTGVLQVIANNEQLRYHLIEDREPRTGKSALHYAAAEGHLEAINVILSAGADIDALTKEIEVTPLFLAVQSDLPDTVEMLLKYNAKVDVGRDPHVKAQSQLMVDLLNHLEN